MYYSLGFPFILLLSVAIAQLFLSQSGPNAIPESVPLSLPNSPLFPIEFSPDIGSSANVINPSPMNLVSSNPTLPTDQLQPGTSPFTNDAFSSGFKIALPSNEIETEPHSKQESLDTLRPTGLEHSDPLCNTFSGTRGRKVRRGDSCGLVDPVGELFNWVQNEYDKARDYLAPLENADTHLTDPDWWRNKRIYGEDGDWLKKDVPELSEEERKRMQKVANEKRQACAHSNPNRAEPLCCLGPPLPSTTNGAQKRAEGVDMENCSKFIDVRPVCFELGRACYFCCALLDTKQETQFGYMGRDCEPIS